MPAKEYFHKFRWNDFKYPKNYPISKIIELFESKLGTVETELRSKTNSYNETKILLTQNSQKEYKFKHI